MTDRAALIEHVDRSWAELQRAVAGLDDQRLIAPGPEGWSIKDHLMHVVHWEVYLLAVLEGRDPMAALGLDPGRKWTEDSENAVLQERDAGLPLDEVRRQLDETHAAVRGRLGALDEGDLERFASVIDGNTWAHFDEHRDWIGGLAAARS
jgi:uncharacterized damage-inducible protein DinB